MKPFFPYFGSKYRTVPRYPAPAHGLIVEPFAGSATYSTRHEPECAVLCEKNPQIAAIWAWLVRASPQDVLDLPDVPAGAEAPPGLPEGAEILMRMWFNRGSASPKRVNMAWGEKSGKPAGSWGPAARRRIADQVEKIRGWEVYCGSYEDLPNGHATWFIDPPYQVMGRHYPCGASAIDFGALGAWCQERQGQVIVCEAGGADWLPFQPLGTFKSTRGFGTAAEVVWSR